MTRIVPNLWYTSEAEEAARFYAATFPDSHVDRVIVMPHDDPHDTSAPVKVVTFTLVGQPFMAISAGPLDPFNHAVSFMVTCEDQAEIDRYWNALLRDGKAEQCGWIRDKYGLCWQIAPAIMGDMMTHPDKERVRRVHEAMMKMVKLDIAQLKAAFEGKP